jgi:hypothetical protein
MKCCYCQNDLTEDFLGTCCPNESCKSIGGIILVKYRSYGIEWFKNGKLHRKDGPALEIINGKKHWCKNGELHRKDGPAVEFPDGYQEYWVEGERIT